MSLVPRARHKWAWWKRQRTYCQKPYSQGKGRTMEIIRQCRIKELNHPRGLDIPGFPTAPARDTGEDLERAPVQVSLPAPTHWRKTCKINCGSSKTHGLCNFISCCMFTFWPVFQSETRLKNKGRISLNPTLFSLSLHRSVTLACPPAAIVQFTFKWL